jgi:hypothetical protein
VLFDVLEDLPGTLEANRKLHEIPFAHFDGLSVFRSDENLALEEETRFLGVIAPGKLRHLLGPNGPGANTELIEAILTRGIFNIDAHIVLLFL